MKKIAILLSVIMSVSILLTGCGKKNTDGDNTSSGSQTEYSGELAVNGTDFRSFSKTYNENHSFSYKATGYYMVKNGKTPYKVVVPETESQNIEYAKSELSRFFKEATGINLKFISDKDLTHSADNRYISLGDTTLYRSLNRNDDIASLKKDGTKIFTQDKSVYIIGGKETGVLNGV